MNAPRGIVLGMLLGLALSCCAWSGWYALRPHHWRPTRSTIGPH